MPPSDLFATEVLHNVGGNLPFLQLPKLNDISKGKILVQNVQWALKYWLAMLELINKDSRM